MRMWNVPPEILCNQHLLGEHVEMHMFAGSINKGISIKGYIKKGLVEPGKIEERHAELVIEMERRGMNHQSPLPRIKKNGYGKGHVDITQSLNTLMRRCARCRKRMAEA